MDRRIKDQREGRRRTDQSLKLQTKKKNKNETQFQIGLRKDLQTLDGFLGKRKLVKKKMASQREKESIEERDKERERKNQALISIFGVPYKSTYVLSLNVNKIKKNI